MTVGTFRAAGVPARSVSAAVYNTSHVLVPSWSQPTVAQLTSGVLSNFTLPAGIASAIGIRDLGFSAVVADGSGGVWLLSYSGILANISSAGALVGSMQTLPKGETYLGLAMRASLPYAATASGRVFVVSAGAVLEVSVNFGTSIRSIASDGTLLFGASPAVGLVTLTFSAVATATAATVAAPMTYAYAITYSSYGIAIAGTTLNSLGLATGYLSANPASPSTGAVVTVPASNQITLLSGTDPAWTIGNSLAVTGPGPIAWAPNGTQILVTQPAANQLLVVAATATPTVSQTLAITGPGQLVILSDSSEALVCQSASGLVAIYTNTAGVWSAASTVAIAGAQSIALLNDSTALVGTASTVVTLTRAGATWSILSSSSVLFSVTHIAAVGSTGVGAAIGTGGASGYLALLQNGVEIGTATWTGGADSLIALPGEVYVMDAAASLVRAFGTATGSSITTQATTAVPASATSFGVTANSYWLCGATTRQIQIDSPYHIRTFHVGSVAVRNAGAWTSATLGIVKQPTGLAFSGAGSLDVVTADNTFFQFNASVAGTVTLTSSGVVAPPPGQSANVPLGLSSLLWSGAVLYVTSSMSDSLGELI